MRFPRIFSLIADGRLHLTAVVLLAPYLVTDNADDLLRAAIHRSRREVELQIAQRFPRPDMPASLRPVPDAAASLDFRDVEAFDAKTAYLLSIGSGAASRIYKTTDGGRTWTAQFTSTTSQTGVASPPGGRGGGSEGLPVPCSTASAWARAMRRASSRRGGSSCARCPMLQDASAALTACSRPICVTRVGAGSGSTAQAERARDRRKRRKLLAFSI